MLKQYVFTEEEINKLIELVKESHDVIWCDVPKQGLTSYMREDLLTNLSDVLDILRGEQ